MALYSGGRPLIFLPMSSRYAGCKTCRIPRRFRQNSRFPFQKRSGPRAAGGQAKYSLLFQGARAFCWYQCPNVMSWRALRAAPNRTIIATGMIALDAARRYLRVDRVADRLQDRHYIADGFAGPYAMGGTDNRSTRIGQMADARNRIGRAHV